MLMVATIYVVKIMPFSNDYESYVDLFTYTFKEPAFDRMEIGFRILVILFKSISEDFMLFWFFMVVISLALKYYVLKSFNTNNYILVLLFLLYGISLLALHEGTQIRAALAIAFGFTGFRCKNPIYAFVFLSLSVLFHYSAFLFLILYICGYYVKSYKFMWLILVISLATILPMLLNQYLSLLIDFNPLFDLYLENSDNTKVNKYSFTLIFAMLFFIVNFFVGRRLSRYSFLDKDIFNKYNLFSFLYLTSAILLSVLSFSPVLSIRLYELLSLSPFVIIACLYTKLVDYIILQHSDVKLLMLRKILLLILVLMSIHRYIAYYFVNPIINFNIQL